MYLSQSDENWKGRNRLLRHIILLQFCFFLLSCQEKSNVKNQPSDSLPKEEKVDSVKTSTIEDQLSRRDSLLNIYKGVKRFDYTTQLTYGTNSLEVITTYINDTLSEADVVNIVVTRPVTQRQRLVFKKNGAVLGSFDVPLKTITRTTISKQNIQSLDVTIWRIYAVEGSTGTVFAVDGSGLCGGSECPEFSGIYSLNGQPLYQKYSDAYDKKEFFSILSNYGISEDSFRKASTNAVRVDYFWQ